MDWGDRERPSRVTRRFSSEFAAGRSFLIFGPSQHFPIPFPTPSCAFHTYFVAPYTTMQTAMRCVLLWGGQECHCFKECINCIIYALYFLFELNAANALANGECFVDAG